MPKSSFQLNKIMVLAGVFGLALVLRLVFALQWADLPYGSVPLLDADAYDKWAQQIAGGQFLRDKAFYLSPLFPYIVGFLYALFGRSLWVISLLNVGLSSGTALILSLVTCEAFGLEAGLVTGVLAAGYLPFIFYAAPVMKESLGLLLLAVFLLHALRALRENRLRSFIFSGAALGVGALVRSNALLLAPVIVIFGLWRWRQKALKNTIVFAVVTIGCILPATLHNYLVSDDFVFISYNAGLNFYFGHSETAGPEGVSAQKFSYPGPEEYAATKIARQALGREPYPSEVSHYWRGRAVDYIEKNPWKDLQSTLKKAIAFWNASSKYDGYDIGFIRANFPTVLALPLADFALIFCLAAVGGVAAWRDRRGEVKILAALVLAYMISVIVFYITDRYRLPVLIFLLPLAGAAAPYVIKLITQKDFRHLLLAAAALAVAAMLSFLPFPYNQDFRAYDWSTLGTLYGNLGENDKAVDALAKGQAFAPATDVQSYIIRAYVAHSQQRDRDAETVFQEAMMAFPEDGALQYNYGRFREATGDLNGALKAMKKAVEFSPNIPVHYVGLASIEERLDQKKLAGRTVADGLKIDPDDAELRDLRRRLQGASQ